MSIDLMLFCRQKVDVGQIAAALEEPYAVHIESDGENWLIFSAPDHECLLSTLWMPDFIDRTLVPPAVTTALRADWFYRYELKTPVGQPDSDLLRVEALIIALASEAGGVVFSCSEDRVVWPEGVPIVDTTEGLSVNVLDLSVYAASSNSRFEWAQSVLDRICTAMPDVLPTKLQSPNSDRWEPFSARRLEEIAGHGGVLSWQATPPCFGGIAISRGVHKAAIQLAAEALNDPNRYSEIQAVIREWASLPGVLHICGSVQRNMAFRDGLLYLQRGTRGSAPWVGMGASWPGLPRIAMRLEWFPPQYADLVERSLARVAIPFEGGLLADYANDERYRLSHIPRELMEGPAPNRPARVIPRPT